MVLNGTIQTVELTYAGQEVAITETAGNLYNERQKVKVSLSKMLEQNELFGIGMNSELKTSPSVCMPRLTWLPMTGPSFRQVGSLRS